MMAVRAAKEQRKITNITKLSLLKVLLFAAVESRSDEVKDRVVMGKDRLVD
jgi:hypothetical protein